MADNVMAFFFQNPKGESGAGQAFNPGPGGMYPESMPVILMGQGTPDGDREPFLSANKGSLYLATDQTDDTTHVWQKVDEGGDNADWVEMLTDNAALGGIPIVVTSALFDISAADSEQVIFTNNLGVTLNIRSISLIWKEATAASGAAEGDVTVGTAAGGAQIVDPAAYPVSTAVGAVTALTLKVTTLAADAEVFVSHDVAASAAGEYIVQLVLVVPN